MSLKEPDFWYPKAGQVSAEAFLLWPVGFFYDMAGRARRAVSRPQKMSVPVICVGNLVAGGVGKTPIAIAVADILKAKGHQPFFLSRGYGGVEEGPKRVEALGDNATAVGDEPLLLARRYPTIVAKNRPAGADLAISQGADCIIMDDGFQNPSISKDLSLVVVDGARGFGNGRVIPAGPLRESVTAGLKRADAVIIVGEDGGVSRQVRATLSSDKVLSARLTPHTEQPMDKKRRYLAFSGIGHPDKFFDTLREYGLPLSDQIPFPDHHVYTEDELSMLREKAISAHAALITTEKDWQRLTEEARAQIWYFGIQADVSNAEVLDAMIDPLFED